MSEPFPCDWPVSYASCASLEPLSSMPPSGKAEMERMAVDYLWNWTGQQFGLCPVALRPCRENCATSAGPFTPALIGGRWYNLACGTCGDSCGCGVTPTLRLPGPVAAVEEVRIDGTVLDAAAYRVDNSRFLTRLDGGRWPTCQDLTLPTTETGTWEVTYTLGTPVPVGGQVTAGVLAVELAKAACRDTTCALPQRIQTMTREGVTIAMIDSFDDIEKGHTGIWIIDSWISSVTRAPVPSRVYSPDVSRRAPMRRV